MGQNVVFFEIEGLNGAAMREFYATLFGWQINVLPNNPAEYALISAAGEGGGISGAISQVPDVPSSTWRGRTRSEGHSGQVMIFVETPDVEASLRQAEALGGTRLLGPDPVRPGVERGIFSDPEGHLIGVITKAG